MAESVTVVMPVWNRRELLEPALGGICAQSHPIAEVVVVDDGSTDDAAALARSLGARVIHMGTHGGFAKAVNCGIRECRTDLIAIVNNDVELAPDWLQKLVAGLREDTWFATGKILQASVRNRIDATYDAVCLGGTAWRVGHDATDGRTFDEARAIWSPPFTAALFRKKLFDRVGLLDERFGSYLEDVDFGLRCARAERAGRYVPGAVAWHQGSATLGRWHPEVVHLISRNQVYLLAKHFPPAMLRRAWWQIAVGQVLWGGVALRHGCAFAWLRGKMEALRNVRDFRDYSTTNLLPILQANERVIARIQRECGADTYWRLYFLLTGGGAT